MKYKKNKVYSMSDTQKANERMENVEGGWEMPDRRTIKFDLLLNANEYGGA